MAAPVLVQSKSAAGGGITFTSANTLGNTIVVFYGYVGAAGPTLSDSNSNSYSTYGLAGSGNLQIGFFIATNIAAGANTVSISTLGSAGFYVICEYSGVTGIEASQPTTATLASGVITTTTPNTLVLMGSGANGSGSYTGTTGSWTIITNNNSGSGYMMLTSHAAASPSNYSNTATQTGGGTSFFTSLVGLKGSGSAVPNLVQYPGMDGGMRPFMTGGMNG